MPPVSLPLNAAQAAASTVAIDKAKLEAMRAAHDTIGIKAVLAVQKGRAPTNCADLCDIESALFAMNFYETYNKSNGITYAFVKDTTSLEYTNTSS